MDLTAEALERQSENVARQVNTAISDLAAAVRRLEVVAAKLAKARSMAQEGQEAPSEARACRGLKEVRDWDGRVVRTTHSRSCPDCYPSHPSNGGAVT